MSKETYYKTLGQCHQHPLTCQKRHTCQKRLLQNSRPMPPASTHKKKSVPSYFL